MSYDFSGWATKNNLLCSDGRVIRKNAFKDQNGKTVPLVWNHRHESPSNLLGNALLENRNDGVYAYCSFNDTPSGKTAKMLVEHGDVTSLSICANSLTENGGEVMHGVIREVSLVLAGANPGASIDSVIRHSDNGDMEELIIYTGEDLSLHHADDDDEEEEEEEASSESAKSDESKSSEKTIGDVLKTLTEEQEKVVSYLIGQALVTSSGENKDEDETDENKKEDTEGGTTVKHNCFDTDENQTSQQNSTTITHSEMQAIISDAKRYGSLKDSVLAHGIEDVFYHATDESGNTIDYGMANVDYLFPDAKNVTNTPIFIKRNTDWVSKVMNGTHHTPFSRIKSILADITEDEARAKGYIKGNQKTEEVFTLLKRTTTPTTIYKKQKMDRDDVIDITDFDVIAWIKSEMRIMLDEELARAFLVGDGRSTASDDKISESNIRPIMNDDDLYSIKVTVETTDDDDEDAKAFIKAAIKARKDYKGSGNPTLFTTEEMLTNMLLITDSLGRDIYLDEAQLAKKLRVKEIVTVPVMEDLDGPNGGELMGIIVNLQDYNVGADKGGAVNMFDDFDIDYNAQKYLIETRCSGALIQPYSAIVLEKTSAA